MRLFSPTRIMCAAVNKGHWKSPFKPGRRRSRACFVPICETLELKATEYERPDDQPLIDPHSDNMHMIHTTSVHPLHTIINLHSLWQLTHTRTHPSAGRHLSDNASPPLVDASLLARHLGLFIRHDGGE